MLRQARSSPGAPGRTAPGRCTSFASWPRRGGRAADDDQPGVRSGGDARRPRDLLAAQADAVGLPLLTVEIPCPCTQRGVRGRDGGGGGAGTRPTASRPSRSAICSSRTSGDIARTGWRHGAEPLFPLWGIRRRAGARDDRRRAARRLTCVDPRQLPASFAGRDFDGAAASAICRRRRSVRRAGRVPLVRVRRTDVQSRGADPRGRVVEREGFVFTDLLLDEARLAAREKARGAPRALGVVVSRPVRFAAGFVGGVTGAVPGELGGDGVSEVDAGAVAEQRRRDADISISSAIRARASGSRE